MKKLLPLFTTLAALAVAALFVNAADAPAAKPLRVLLVAGGCCHDYAKQQELLKAGIESRINAVVEVAYNPDKTTKATFDIYKSKDWAKDFDVVIHDECSADVTKDSHPGYVENILAAHKNGTPAVNLHCAMHSYRWGKYQEPVQPGADNAGWFEMIGIQSTRHGPQEPIAVTYTDSASPITKGLENWTTIKEELYNNVQILTAKPLAKGKQSYTDKKSGQAKEDETVVAWTNEYGEKKTRIFSTTLGHNNDTVADARYLDLVTRGLLWSCGKLGDDGKAVAGFGK
jgi:type 1 glutamine amidotransferase